MTVKGGGVKKGKGDREGRGMEEEKIFVGGKRACVEAGYLHT